MIGSRPLATPPARPALAVATTAITAALNSAARARIHQRSSTWVPRRAAAWGVGEWRVAARRSCCADAAPSCRGTEGSGLGATRAVGWAELRDRGSARRVLRASERGAGRAWAPAWAAECAARPDVIRARPTPREPRVFRAGSGVPRGRAPTPRPLLDAVIVNPGSADDSPAGSACAPLPSRAPADVGCGPVGAETAEPLAADWSTEAACDGVGAGAGGAAGADGGLAAPRGGSKLRGST
jgi:hypothetical protein